MELHKGYYYEEMDRYETNRSRNYRSTERWKDTARDSGTFWIEQKADRELGRKIQQRANENGPRDISPTKRPPPEKMDSRRIRMREESLRDFGWRIGCYGIFCGLQKGGHVICIYWKASPISTMCLFFVASRSGYHRFVYHLGRLERDAGLGTAERTTGACATELRSPEDVVMVGKSRYPI